jgi:hypothetical protein
MRAAIRSRRRQVRRVVLALCLAGIAPATAAAASSPPGPTFRPPVVAIPPAPGGLPLAGPVANTSAAMTEPRLLVAPDGRVFVSSMTQFRDCTTGAAVSRPAADCVWRSEDDGQSFTLSGSGTDMGSDVEFARLPTGTFIHAGMTNVNLGSGVGGVTVHRSVDGGHTWSSSILNGFDPLIDREWLTVVGSDVLLFFTALPGNVYVSRSTDDGATFGIPTVVTVAPPGLVLSPSGGPTYDVARHEVIVPYETAPENTLPPIYRQRIEGSTALRVARSTDAGQTWTDEPVTTYDIVQGVSSLAADGQGREYLVYTTTTNGSVAVWLTRQDAAGGPWSTPTRITPDGQSGFLSWVVARGDGGVAAAWIGTDSPDADQTHDWSIRVATSSDAGHTWQYADASGHSIYTGTQFDSASVVFDLFGLTVDDGGMLHLAWTRQLDPAGNRTLTQIEYTKQQSGAPLGEPVQEPVVPESPAVLLLPLGAALLLGVAFVRKRLQG